MDAQTQVAITGSGVVCPTGMNTQDFWDNLCQGNSGIDKIKAFDASKFTCQIAGEVDDYKIRNFVPKSHRKATKLMSRDIELAVIAAKEAVASSGIVTKETDPENAENIPSKTAINFGAGLISCELDELSQAAKGSIIDGKFDMHAWGEPGMQSLTPLWLLKYLPNMLACHVGIIHDIQGPSNSITCGEASSHIAIIEAMQVIQRGSANVALAGGGESKVNPIVLLRQCLLKRATENNEPQTACRPFDANSTGSVFGEAAGVFVLEDLERAEKRNAPILATIAGYGQSTSPNTDYAHIEPDGKGLAIAIEKAMESAGITASEIDLIVPHGTAIAQDDVAEAKALESVLGDAVKTIPAMPIKSMTSNTGAASGSLDILAAIKAMQTSTIPAVKNFDAPVEGCNLNINTQTINKEIKYALCTSYTFGGQTAAIILKNAK